uniref:Uncharacterized protein n=1 Tax=Babesia bovis TaxID=5865 RepID=A7APZ0_BABBO|eukprot:XP_001612192.1 hypothetical protein [Babesia bovis T2Bo]
MLPPVESMPRNVMRSAKKLRNFFGVPEAQICRGCVKRVRCRKYQQPVTLEEKERNRLLQKHRKLVELKQLEILKEKAFNLPKHFNVTPAEYTYMTSFQRDMYKKLSKPLNKRNEDDDIWVLDRGDTTLSDDPDDTFKGLSKLNDAHLYTLPKSITADPVDPKHVEQLHPGTVQFRMNYDTPMGGDLDIVRYDIKQDSFIQGVKVNAKGKVVIDLEKHVTSPNPHIDIAKGLEAYRPISENVASRYQSLVKSLETDSMRLPFLKHVNYDFGSQSSGGIDQPNDKNSTNEASHLEDLITALHS